MTCYYQPAFKFEVSIFAHYEYMNWDTKKFGKGVVWGSWGSLKVTENSAI